MNCKPKSSTLHNVGKPDTNPAMNIKTILIAVMTLTLLTGCGRNGRPLTPSAAAAKQAKANNEPIPEKQVQNNSNPDKRFVLDSLLD